MRTLLLSVCLGLLAGPALAQTLALRGPAGQTVTLTAADIDRLPQVRVALNVHGAKHLYQGPLLVDVLAKAGAPGGATMHRPALSDAVVVSGSDGYYVVFGLAEADPAVRPSHIILADRVDGGPLGAKEGPFRLAVEGDLEARRSVRMVTNIAVIHMPAPKP